MENVEQICFIRRIVFKKELSLENYLFIRNWCALALFAIKGEKREEFVRELG